MVELDNSKDTTQTDCLDLRMEDLLVYTKVLCSAAEIACKGRQDFYLGHDGGFMIPMYSEHSSRNENSLREIGELVRKE